MKLAVVVQRYGEGVHGGTELHARYIAEHLVQHAELEVLTTCARDERTWANGFKSGQEKINGVTVRRFRVSKSRSENASARLRARVFNETHSLGDELKWIEAEGPVSRGLVRHLRRHGESYDFCLFFDYRYCHSFYGAHAVPSRAVLVPRAERDHAIGLRVFHDVFRGARAILYNSPEERSLIQGVARNAQVPGVIVGAGVDVPANPQAGRFRQAHNIRGGFALYIGRVDDRQGCAELFDLFQRYAKERSSRLSLVVAGDGPLGIPAHQRIRHVGVLDDASKFDAMAAADVVLVPSRYESLSRTALEAWTLGKPVLANGRSDVLRGQCTRGNGGLCYQNAGEFAAMLQAIEGNRWLSATLGRSGRQYVRDHYDWRVIERKYHEMFVQLQKAPPKDGIPPLPGWSERRKRDVPPAADVLRSAS
ncbi:MAG TPA: glycosyltransferase family 4 protein [Vicinamibacterales bacterium]|nr:glycosyltransferase family 4 protein [Vicinamibacterales bacterium]